MDAREFMEWVAYDRVEPLPDPWMQTGLICSLLYNANRTSGPSRSPADFIPAERPSVAPLPDNGLAMLLAMAGGKAQQQMCIPGGERPHG